MMRFYSKVLFSILLAAALTSGCQNPPAGQIDLVGAWRADVQSKTGAFAAVNDLKFVYAFNPGGTMTESSNHDAAPPVPPAYGIWRQVGVNQFEAKYEFFVTKAPVSLDDLTKGAGWLPAGHGVLVDTITLTADGKAFTSKIHYEAFDQAGRRVNSGEATARGERMAF